MNSCIKNAASASRISVLLRAHRAAANAGFHAGFLPLESRLCFSAPSVESVDASLGFGRFIESVTVENTFSANVSDADDDPIDRVEFVLNQEYHVDNDGSDGWQASFDMGNLAADSMLQVTAVDTQGEVSATRSTLIHARPVPDWMRDDDLFTGTVESAGADGYTATIVAGAHALTYLPDFFPDALLGTQGFGAALSGELGFVTGLQYEVAIPFSGTPTVTGVSFLTFAKVLGILEYQKSVELEVSQGTTNWTIFQPSQDDIHEIRLTLPKSGVLGSGMVIPGFFGNGTATFAMNEDLTLDFTSRSTFQVVIKPGAMPSIPVMEMNLFTPHEPLFVGLPLPMFSINLNVSVLFDVELWGEGTVEASYRSGAYSAEVKSFEAGFVLDMGTTFSFGAGLPEDYREVFGDDVTQSASAGFRVGGFLAYGLKLENHDLRVSMDGQPIVLSAYYRPSGSTVGFRLPFWSAGSVHSEDLLHADLQTLFEAPAPPTYSQYDPPESIAETAIASSGDSAVLGYLTEPTSTTPSKLYARVLENGVYSAPELITDTDYERVGLAMGLAGDVPFAMWTQSSIERYPATQLPVVEAIAARDVYWSRRVNGSWTTPAQLTWDSQLDWRPSLAFNADGSAGLAAWVHNESADSGFGGLTNEIMISRWDGTSWSSPVRVTADANRDRAPSVAALEDGRFTVSWSRTAGSEEHVVYAVVDSASATVTSLGIAHTAPTGSTVDGVTSTALGDGRVCIGWIETDSTGRKRIYTTFVTISNGAATAPAIVADNAISSSEISMSRHGGQVAISFCAASALGSTETRSHVWVSYRSTSNGTSWTRPVPVTSGDRDSTSPGAAYLSDHSLLVPFAQSDLLGEGTELIPSPLGSGLTDPTGEQVAHIAARPDLTFDDVSIDRPGALQGTAVVLSATIGNAGSVESGPFLFRVTSEDGAVVWQENLVLAPGERLVRNLALTTASDAWRFRLELDPARLVTELSDSNNTRDMSSASTPIVTAVQSAVPFGAADSSDTHSVSIVNAAGQTLLFRQSAGGWTVTELGSAAGGAPSAIGEAVTWVDPKDNLTYVAAPTASGLILFARSAQGVWTVRNLATESGATDIPTRSLTSFTSVGGIVVVAGLTEDGRIVAFQQILGQVSGGGPAFKFVDISADLTSQGMTTPALENLISYVPSWDTWHMAGIDTSGRVQSVWIAPAQFTKWRTDDLTEITGAPSMKGQLAVTLTSWGGINLTGLDSGGKLQTTWWVPSFGSAWLVNDLTTQFNGTPLIEGNVSGYTTPWGGLNYVGLGADGTVMVYWWSPGMSDWAVSPLLPDNTSSEDRPTGALTSSSSAAGTLNVYGINDDGEVLRMWWKPGLADHWAVENLSELSV